MPAHRSRTERWRELLEQIAQRGGGIEITVDRGSSATEEPSTCLMWRVRVYSVSDDMLTVEQPGAAGRSMTLAEGTPLLGIMSVGQNRWIFRTRVAGVRPGLVGRSGMLSLVMPEGMERCARREHIRVSTTELRLPSVECWPLLEPASVAMAEAANRERIRSMLHHESSRTDAFLGDMLPEVGPKFTATLVNIGGGGVGLQVAKADAAAAGRCRLLWIRLNLTPEIPAPLALTSKVVHTHLDSAQNLYLGAAFDFDFNPSHREFVVEQITRYLNLIQSVRRAA
ncbi:MAG: hypothetical protein HBSAPP03_27600 [Phycisphaerae bacterium]|nr:MAG: hypothetical protein HBSAPP03_27600 [Phycisphaerae bacterium]